jgi:hypothetical protein
VLVVVLVLENPYNIGEGPISAISTISERDRSNIGRSVFFLLHFYLLFCIVCFTPMRFPRVKAEGQSFYHCVSRVVDRQFIFQTAGHGSPGYIGEGQVKYRKKRAF